MIIKELFGRQSTVDWLNKRKTSRTWEVITDSVATEQAQVEASWIAYTGITAGVPYPGEPYVRAKDISVDCVGGNGLKWEVTCNYESTDRDQPTNPLYDPIQIKGSFGKISEKAERDIYGRAILNSAYDPFIEALEVEVSQHVAAYTKNVSYLAFNPLMASYYSNAINATTFLGAPRYTLKCTEFSYESNWDTYIGYYWTVTVGFAYNPNKWWRQILDRGFRKLDDNGDRVDIVDEKTKKKVSEPALLDGAGALLPKGDPEQYKQVWVNPILPFSYFATLLGL